MPSQFYTAQEACHQLNISAASLYAYVSRGLIRSEALPGERKKRYLAADVQALLQRKAIRQAPEQAAMGALNWGLPVMESGISQIQNGVLSYRQRPLESLITLSYPELLELLWQAPITEFESPLIPDLEMPTSPLSSWTERLQMYLPWLAAHDLQSFDLSPEGALRSSRALLNWVWSLISGVRLRPEAPAKRSSAVPQDPSQNLPLNTEQQALLQCLLLISADHELNISSFTARCVASAQGTPHAAVSAALAALGGMRHGGNSLQVQAVLNAACQDGVLPALKNHLRRQGQIPGFGHSLYPEGDPRWVLLRPFLEPFAQQPTLAKGLELVHWGQELTGQQPTLDLALVLASSCLLPQHLNALDWFALGRLPGWLAHIQEQYQQGQMIRPRAKTKPEQTA